jgi:hypothetical protein
MENVSLSVPFLNLSTEVNISGEVENHILTPFGYIDIILPNNSPERDPSLPFEIKVIGDISSWMLDDLMPDEFRSTLFKFIGKIVRYYVGASLPELSQIVICFKGRDLDVKGSWCMCVNMKDHKRE